MILRMLLKYISSGIIRNNGTIASNGQQTNFGSGSIGLYFANDTIYGLGIGNAENANITATSISGDAKAISSTYISLYDGGIVNQGTLSAESAIDNAYGIYLISLFSTNNFNIHNLSTGSITATANSTTAKKNSVGIYLESDVINSTLSNAGNITATGPKSAGIEIYKNGDLAITNTDISNSGNITSTSLSTYQYSNFAKGILVTVEEGSVTIDDSNITNTATGNITLNALDTASGIEVYSDGALTLTGSTILNQGLIDATSRDGSAYGIKVSYNYGGTFTQNNTTIQNDGNISVSAFDSAYGIALAAQGTSSLIKNTGTITAYGMNARGINSYGMSDETATINNEGTINVNGTDWAYGIVAGGTAGTIDNSGTVNATINNEFDVDAFSINTFSSSGISVTNSGTLNGNIRVAGELTNSGTISLPYNANISAGNNSNPLIETFINSGTLKIGLLTDGQTTTYSQLTTTAATFNTGSVINVNVLSSSTQVALLSGTTLENVVSSNSLAINDLTITDNSALLDFEYIEDGETIDLTAVEAQVSGNTGTTTGNITNHTIAGNGSSNAYRAALILDTFSSDTVTYPEMTQLVGQLNLLATDAEVAAALESTTPQTTSATVGAASQISNGIAGIVEQRQQANISTGLNSGDAMFASKNVWLKTYGSIGKQNDKDDMNGFGVNSYGLGMGIDAEYKDKQSIGIALFYTKANVDVNNVSQTSDLDVFTTLVYGNVPMIDDKTNFLYQLGYALQQTDSTRNLFTGETAKAEYTSKTASIDLKVMRDYAINKSFLLQPMVSTTYRHFDNPAYSETGAGANSLNVDAFTSSEILLGIGTLAHYKLDENSKIIGNVKVDYDAKGDNASVTSAFQGASGVTFETDGIDNGRWSYDAGVGYEREVKEGHNFNVTYNYQGKGSDYSNNVISAKYTYTF